MKRQVFLQPLSREHHHALVLARKAVRWASEANLDAWQRVQDAYRTELAPHFEYEEVSLLPLIIETHGDLVKRTLDDHKRLTELALGGSTLHELALFGKVLSEHVRFEERQLFPALERASECLDRE